MGAVLIPLTKGFLLFVLFQTSLILYANAQENTTVTTMGYNVTTNQTLNSTNTTQAPSMNDTSTTGTNVTMPAMVSCQVLSCNYSVCYNALLSTNFTTCSASEMFCELTKDGGAIYSVRCTNTCLSACMNTSQNNCSINCCSSNCVNSTLNSLLNSTSIMTTTTTSTITSTTTKNTTVATTTIATNGKICHKLSCTGETCYQGIATTTLCAPGQNFCMLKKTPALTMTTWTAGCVMDCSKETVCTSSNTNCILECCNATTTASCLKLNGQVNVVGSGTVAPCSYVTLVVSSFFLWLLMMGKPAD